VRLPRSFFRPDPVSLAQNILGQRLVRVLPNGARLAGIIVETEAYLGAPDRASHAFNLRRTPRNAAMYAQAGTAYVYFTYGMHFCFNIVCGKVDEPLAVLIRALEPTEGLDLMRTHRSVKRGKKADLRAHPRASLRDRDLCSGPARLCQALAVDRTLNAIDLTSDTRLFVERAQRTRLDDDALLVTPRIGVDYAGPWASEKLRWLIRGNPNVSGRPVPGLTQA